MKGYDLLVLCVDDMKVGDRLMLINEGVHTAVFRKITKISKADPGYATKQKVLVLEHWHSDVWLYPDELTMIARPKKRKDR